MPVDDVLFAIADPSVRARFTPAPGIHTSLDEVPGLLAETAAEVVVVDDADASVIDRCTAWRVQFPNVRVVVLTAGGRDVAWPALQAGATSVIGTRAGLAEVLDTAAAARRGESVLDAPTAGLLLAHMRRTAIEHNDPFERAVRLTEIEDELLSDLAQHRSLAHIAVDRHVTERLVCVHVGYAVAKLHDPVHRATRPVATSLAETARRVAAARRHATAGRSVSADTTRTNR